jgi:asparagine synthetase B (glutamine-hydrolysing)
MCGLFGFSGPGRGNMSLITELALLAGRRGPDAWGVWNDGTTIARMGRVTGEALRGLAPAHATMGHARLATVLGTKRVECCQPLAVGDFVVTHNGVVPNAQALADEFGFRLGTGVDSEAIAHLLNRHDARLGAVMSLVDLGPHAVVALNRRTGTVEFQAGGLPLWTRQQPEGVYWCSVRPGDGWRPAHA